jgi:gamma-glutamylcyclotransferase (GGCT)/AIG2-like uncharacterized protein YtfP
MPHVFTYGSLMFPEVWRIVVGRDFETVEGTAEGFAIFRVRDAVFPGITQADGCRAVPGLVYLDVDDAAVARLDKFESDFYDRLSLSIDCVDGHRCAADAYVVSEENRYVLTAESWTAKSFVASGGLTDFIERYQGFSWLREDA